MARVRTPSFWMVFCTVPTCDSILVIRVSKVLNSRLVPSRTFQYFVAFFLNGEHVEAHLEAGEDGGEGAGAGDGDVAARLDLGLESVAAHDFGVEALGGKEHDGVRGGDGRVDVLFADAIAFGADGGFEGLACRCDAFGEVALVGGFEALPVFAGELGVDGKEGFARVAGEADGELDDLQRTFLYLCVAHKLAGGEHLFEQHAELDFREAAAGLDVGEDAAEVVDAVGELGHLAQAAVDLVELVGDLAEGFGEAGLQGVVEFLVDGLAHLLELFGVVFVELAEAFFDGVAEALLQGGVAGHQLVELGVERLAEAGVALVGFAGEGGDALGDGVHLMLDGVAEEVVGGLVVGAEAVEAGLEYLAEVCDVAGDLGAKGGEVGCACGAGALGLGGDVGAHLGEGGADVVVEGLVAGVEAGELIGNLGEAGVLRGGRLPAEKQEDYGEEGDDLEDEERGRHFVFPSPKDSISRREIFPKGNETYL